MDMPPPPQAAQGRRASTVVERKLDELCACLDGALSSRRRLPGAEARLAAEIKAKTDFLRSLLAAEAECHGGAGARPDYLAEAEARFAVLEATFDNWARRAAPAPEPEEEKKKEDAEKPQEEADADGTASTGSTCSCTGSCQEAAAEDGVASKGHDAAETRGEAASGAVAAQKPREAVGTRVEDATPKQDAAGKRRDAEHEAAAGTGRRTVAQRRWWRRGAAWCGAAGVVAVVAVGVAVELAAVAPHNVNVYVVPT
ncbi:unnamed protein product [Urochloa humidicola]